VKIFCDTNVIVAASSEQHPHHQIARPVLERVKAGKDEGFIGAHTLAEAYAVLTRLPGSAAVDAATAWQLISENAVQNFKVITLTAAEYADVVERASQNGVEGGKIYDLLLLRAAAKSGAARILTFNVRHFHALADPLLRARIAAP
jgi:predicted nucleic acid-binding protein